jgi:hypothetical protein
MEVFQLPDVVAQWDHCSEIVKFWMYRGLTGLPSFNALR